MQPDYTLSIWPAEYDKAEAEKCEVLVHVHFDAKYRGNAEGVRPLFVSYLDYDPRGQCDFC